MYAGRSRDTGYSLCEMKEFSFPVPADLVKKTVGLALDMGGSVIKFVYRSRENLKESENTSNGMGHLQFVSFSKPDMAIALDYIRERCVLTREENDEVPEIRTTGLGCTLNGKLLCEKFNAHIKNIIEFDCFTSALIFLASKLPRKLLLHPFDDDATVEPIQTFKDQMRLFTTPDDQGSQSLQAFNEVVDFSGSILGKIVNESDDPMASTEDVYPCVLAMCGSGIGYLVINSDLTSAILDISHRGGRAFFGMGSLLTGCKNYEELVELAAHGDPKNVDIYSDSLFDAENASSGDNSIYAQAADKNISPAIIYSFGKAVGAEIDNFCREDLARSWLNYVVIDTAQSLSLFCQVQKVKRVFFCGSFCNSPLVRSVMTAEMTRRNLFYTSTGNQTISFDFVKPGPHLGALGALINQANANSFPSTNLSSLYDMTEFSFPVPADLVKKTVGLSLDMGGSVIKFVYRSRENLAESENTSNGMGHLQFVSFSKPDMAIALDYIRERCVITREENDEVPEIRTTGLGCTVNGKLLCEKFNAHIKNIIEFDCFTSAFTYLASKLPRKLLLHPFDDDATSEPVETLKGQLGLLQAKDEDSQSLQAFSTNIDFSGSSLGKIVNESDDPMASTEDVYPCVLAMCGSGFGYMLINSDLTSRTLDGSNRGGKAFYGIGSLFTGCKNYEELVELAAHGDPRNVDVYSDCLFDAENASSGDNSIYAQAADKTKNSSPAIVYSFGKAVGAKLDDFRREDLARSWLNYVALDLAQSLSLFCQVQKVKRVFFCGSFCNSPLVRSVLTTEMARRNLLYVSTGSQTIGFDFVKPGPHLGALGALINQVNANSVSSTNL